VQHEYSVRDAMENASKYKMPATKATSRPRAIRTSASH
jgi:hypothetical protein